jgi:hypothetical protein
MRMSDHRGYAQAVAKLETLEQETITARAQAEAAQAAVAATEERALTLKYTSASFDADLARRRDEAKSAGARAGAAEEARDAQRQVVEQTGQAATAQIVSQAHDRHAKAVSRIGAAIRKLLAGMEDEQDARATLWRSLVEELPPGSPLVEQIERSLPALKLEILDPHRRDQARELLSLWLRDAKAAGYRV